MSAVSKWMAAIHNLMTAVVMEHTAECGDQTIHNTLNCLTEESGRHLLNFLMPPRVTDHEARDYNVILSLVLY